MEYPDLTGDQVKRIINLVKWIAGFVIGAITIVTTVSLYLSYDSIKEIKAEVKTETSDIKNEVEKLMQFSRDEIDRFNEFSEKHVKLVTEDAIYQAKKNAEKEVSDYFENDTEVKRLINNSAENILSRFEKDVNGFTVRLPDILLALEEVGRGERVGIEKIIDLKNNSNNRFIKELASEVFIKKKQDFYNVFNHNNGSFWNSDIADFLVKIKNDPTSYLDFAEIINNGNIHLKNTATQDEWSNSDKNVLIERLIKNVNESKDLNVVTISFFLIQEMTNIRSELFDFVDFEKKSKSYKIDGKYL
ncbi:MAG: hypothetical protein J0L67_01525 [Cytophagales bacterium]|nr:hypothetical protein [Cytophagales bacterium]